MKMKAIRATRIRAVERLARMPLAYGFAQYLSRSSYSLFKL
jgi:hypothetical protein